MFKVLQKIGKAFMLPIAILPAAGLLLGIGGALSNPTTVATYPVLNNRALQAYFHSDELSRGSCICEFSITTLRRFVYWFSKT